MGAVFWVFGWSIGNYVTGPSSGGKAKPNPIPPVDSSGGPYYRGAVAADAKNCSAIGVNILKRKGSAVDAAIATMLCVGVINMHSTGVGGGGFMLVYNKTSNTTEAIDFREKAPVAANESMFVDKVRDAKFGGLAVGVPGEVRGYYKAWEKYGRLRWRDIVQPAIDIAKNGFYIGKPVHDAASELKDEIINNPGLRELLFKTDGKTLKDRDSPITNLKYAATLKTIRDNPHSFYNGTLARNIIRDIQFMEPQGIMGLDDLKNYTAEIRKGLSGRLGPNLVMHTVPPPASGAVMHLLLDILKGYNFTESSRDLKDTNTSTLTYHRITEASKFAFAWRSRLADPAFDGSVEKYVEKMLDQSTADYLRAQIWDNQTHDNVSYYANYFSYEDHGTSHLAVLAPNGDAVSLTSSINLRFGNQHRSTTTGIIYNDQMSDFDNPGSKRHAGLSPSELNFPAPGKRPFSSMTPVIITDNNGNVKMVFGASGGKQIITATSQAIMNKLWFGRSLKQSIEDLRIHTQLIPDDFLYHEANFPRDILDGLRNLGHDLKELKHYAAVQGIVRETRGEIYAWSDSRKSGKPGGF
ncbi:predicted protein [Nematostella vectensis]|uniref:Gamma-glutamyltransferase n=2 Tax=Nematostella vectensis TaxID=45351 RepID=A7RVG4_NEMVE|nr:predicted protein [Nematostella vectensis]|eukprot:XP_001636635.1 predicted protein [Nematostella vectensis]